MAGYSARQSSFSSGDTITAAHSNDEFNTILAAFNVSTGHTHDGSTAGDGGPISKLFSNAITFGTNANTDIAVTFDGSSNDGVLTWMEDEDYFQFSDDILLTTTEKLQFRDTAIYIHSSADGQLDLVADTEIQIAATTVDINGAVDVSGNLGVGGNLTVTGTTTFNGGTLTLGDANTDNIVFGGEVDSDIIPDDDGTFDLGSASKEWQDLFIDGTAKVDTLTVDENATVAGTLGVTGVLTANAGVVVDNITIDGTEIDLSSGDLTLDVAGDIVLDAGGSDISLKSGGAEYGKFNLTGNNLNIHSSISDGDILFKGSDGGSAITALTLDMSAGGQATFNSEITASGTSNFVNLDISGDVDVDGTTNLDNTDIDGTLVVDGSNISLDSTSTLNIDNSNTTNGITIGTATSGVPISIGHSTSETTINDNLTVTGNFTVSGTSTTVDSTTVSVADSMFKLAKDQGTSADALDFGFYGQYGVGGTAKFAGVFRDVSATGDPFTFFDDLQAEPGTTVNTGCLLYTSPSPRD